MKNRQVILDMDDFKDLEKRANQDNFTSIDDSLLVLKDVLLFIGRRVGDLDKIITIYNQENNEFQIHIQPSFVGGVDGIKVVFGRKAKK